MVDNINDNKISEIDAKKDLNALDEIKNAEKIKYKKRTPGHKKLLNLFSKLKIILTDKTFESQKAENYENEDDEYENEDEDYENKNEYEKEDDHDDKTIDQKKIKGLNDILHEIIGKSKSFEEKIESLKKLEGLKGYWPFNDYDDKELKSNYFKIQLADISNEIDEKLFEQTCGHTLIKLTDKLINTTNKEENQIIVNSIKKNKYKLFKMDEFSD